MITLLEPSAQAFNEPIHPSASRSWQAEVPIIERGGAPYDLDLQRFLADLSLNGVRSQHSVRAYSYDILVWVRFLEARGKTVWQAARTDVNTYHRARRHGDAINRISAPSWNRAVAALDKLYKWGVEENLIAKNPFVYRDIWRRSTAGGRVGVVAHNNAYERAAKRNDVKFVTMEDYRRFRDVGLQSLTPDGGHRQGARDRNSIRNALFADLLISTGLRLEEASSLLAMEIDQLHCLRSDNEKQLPFRLAASLTKGDKGRTIRIPATLLIQLRSYSEIERSVASEKFRHREGWQRIRAPILCRITSNSKIEILSREAGWRSCNLDCLTPDERRRLVLCDANGNPQRAAALWLTEDGRPVAPNSWEVAFARASRRCCEAGPALYVTPHQLRHSFAVHMLALLLHQQIGGRSGDNQHDLSGAAYRQLLGDPLQQVQRLLGHSSIATTYIYLDHLAGCQDTVDMAIEELLAGLKNEATTIRTTA